jgi:DNA-directed RNA polymerase specialized sigma24 family protein
MSRKPDESRRASARRLHGLKVPTARIAAQLGVERRTVQRWLGEDAGRPGPPKNPAVPDAKILDLRDREGLSYREIASLTGMSESGVRNRYHSLTGGRPDRA